jgi:glycosyltransferase involved in cell wall biosynthesis
MPEALADAPVVRRDTVHRPPRVAHFAGTMRPGHDGVTRVLYRMIDDLAERQRPALFFSPIVPPGPVHGVRIAPVPSITFPLYKDYRLALPGSRHFEEELDAFCPDLLHIHSPCSLGLAAVGYGRRKGIPVVATYHTHFPSYAKYYRIPALEMWGWNYLRMVYGGCSRVYVPSKPILEDLRDQAIPHLEHLPHGVDAERFHPRFRTRAWKERLGIQGKTVLLFAGRLVWEKDLTTLAQTWQIVSRQRGDVALVLAGDGPIRAELERMMPGAIFLGQQSGDDLAATFASSDVFVFPSTTETFGNVTLEAMASGIVPICAREGGAWGVVDDGVTGLHAVPRDPMDLASRIGFLLEHPGHRAAMADRALRFARTQSWTSVFDLLHASYTEVLREHRTRLLHRRTRKAA